jgi:hypothetical protein
MARIESSFFAGVFVNAINRTNRCTRVPMTSGERVSRRRVNSTVMQLGTIGRSARDLGKEMQAT